VKFNYENYGRVTIQDLMMKERILKLNLLPKSAESQSRMAAAHDDSVKNKYLVSFRVFS
jgi:hypothetical protein